MKYWNHVLQVCGADTALMENYFSNYDGFPQILEVRILLHV